MNDKLKAALITLTILGVSFVLFILPPMYLIIASVALAAVALYIVVYNLIKLYE